ncbi:hypothetical protein [Streptomyces sp. NPDC021224]|uniref:hypothetical protein n=1 Tax=unclassified Streptomyces TaxID=2593676 RepID=UPI00379049E7
MLTVSPVLETPEVRDFPFWPVAGFPPYTFAPLSGRMTGPEVGSALAMLADYNARAGDGDYPTDAEGLIRGLLETEKILAPGGLRLHDTATGVSVLPGCCCGLEDWREWLAVPDGASPWLGHDPSPHVEHAPGLVRVWPDTPAKTARPLHFPPSALPPLLHAVQRDLRGFLSLAVRWAVHHVPSLADGLAAALDAGLDVGAPPASG